MRLYVLIYSIFDCMSCKTMPDDFDTMREVEENQQFPCQFFILR